MVLKQCFAQPTGAVAGAKLLLGLRLVMKQLPVQLRGCKGGYRCSEFQQHVLELKLRCSWYSGSREKFGHDRRFYVTPDGAALAVDVWVSQLDEASPVTVINS